MQAKLCMHTLHLYNTLHQKKEPLIPVKSGRIGIYSCGPTVYRSVHIGNLRIYLLSDWLRRVCEYLGYSVTHVKNITDVGHMRQEMLDRGEDKMIAAARAEGKTSKEIAAYYTDEFVTAEEKINILRTHHMPKATEHIPECIEIIEKLLKKGYAYEKKGTIYFDVSRFMDYGKLSGNRITSLLQGVRMEVDKQKKSPEDFALWKAAERGRQMKWKSPWGEGFPGWHIECSAMSMKYLGNEFDIHTGGVDNIFPHHEDEIAQSEAVTGQQVVRYWIHGQHLLADGLKMAKSTGNSYTLADIENRGFDPLSLRYLTLTAHYRRRLNFTFTSLKAAQRGLTRLRDRVRLLEQEADNQPFTSQEVLKEWKEKFIAHILDDLNLPHAFAFAHKILNSHLLPQKKLSLIYDFDRVFGFDLKGFVENHRKFPEHITSALSRRQNYRKNRQFDDADTIRQTFLKQGMRLQDTHEGTHIRYQSIVESITQMPQYSSSKEVPSFLTMPDRYEFSFVIVARNNFNDLVRCIKSIQLWCSTSDYEIVVVDNGSVDETFHLVDALSNEKNIRIVHADHNVGEGAAKNMGIKQSQGKFIFFLDSSLEITGDVIGPVKSALNEKETGIAGHRGMCTGDFKSFHDDPGPFVDAVQFYCLALRRSIFSLIGLLNEKFIFYRHLDLSLCFEAKNAGFKIYALAELPLIYHEHKAWAELTEEERFKKSRHNFYIFYKKWHHKKELLTCPS